MPSESSPPLALPAGLAFPDLYSTDGAARIDALFIAPSARGRCARWRHASPRRRDKPDALSRQDESELLLALGPHLEDFLAHLFGVEPEVRALEAVHHELAPLYAVKRLFVQRKAMNAHKADVAATFDGAALQREIEALLGESFTELVFAKAVTRWQQDESDERERARRGDALRRVGGAHRGGTRGAQGRRAVPRAAQARLPEARPAASSRR